MHFAPIRRITHPTRLQKTDEAALAHAVRVATGTGSELDVLHVDPRAHQLDPSEFPDVEGLTREWESPARPRYERIAVFGKEPVGPILEHLDDRPADVVVLATHRRDGLDRLLHREIAGRIARHHPAMTLFLPFGVDGFVSTSRGTCSLRRVLLPVDWSPTPQIAVDAVALLAKALGVSELDATLLHVGGTELEFPSLDIGEVSGWFWHRRLEEGDDVVGTVLRVAEELDADLIVMPTHAHDGFLDALRGSTTERVLQGCACPLLSVPALAG